MEAANTGVNKFNSVVRDQHICKSVWTPLNDKMHKCVMQEDSNRQDEYTVNNQL